jgi:hypothetical protein
MTTRSSSKMLVMKAAVIAIAICAGATAIHAWQVRTNKVEVKPAAAKSGLSSFILDLHNNAHLDNLPVQAIDGRD